jgi:hypothetical protein
MAGAMALIEYLKNQIKQPEAILCEEPQDGSLPVKSPRGITVGNWLERFTSLDNNPRAARLIAEGSPYSPDTLALYKANFNCHLKNDPFMAMNMDETGSPTPLLLWPAPAAGRQKTGGIWQEPGPLKL